MITGGGVVIDFKKKGQRMTHILKIEKRYYLAIEAEIKNFAVVKDDKNFKVGNWIKFIELDNGRETGRELKTKKVSYVIKSNESSGINPGYAVIQFD